MWALDLIGSTILLPTVAVALTQQAYCCLHGPQWIVLLAAYFGLAAMESPVDVVTRYSDADPLTGW
jgi:predicted neuraminidase